MCNTLYNNKKRARDLYRVIVDEGEVQIIWHA